MIQENRIIKATITRTASIIQFLTPAFALIASFTLWLTFASIPVTHRANRLMIAMKNATYLLYFIIVPARVLNIPRFPTTSVELWLPAVSTLPAESKTPAALRSTIFVLCFILSLYLTFTLNFTLE